jgi:haloalkane dehalogenase
MANVDGTRIHFVDHGEGPVVLLMHGNPTWSFLWREVIAALSPMGVRCIAPDLWGLGLSDKPRRPAAHSLSTHIALMRTLVDALSPDELILVGQDWGGPIVTGVGHAMPERVVGMVLANTSVLVPARPFRSKSFHRFSHLPIVSDAVFRGLLFPVPVLRRVQGDASSIGPRETLAYAWPLRHLQDRAAPLGLARMVPDAESHPSTAVLDEVGAWVASWEGPAALVWGLADPILGRALSRHHLALPQASVRETEAGHFLQEEVPEVLAEAILEVAQKAKLLF